MMFNVISQILSSNVKYWSLLKLMTNKFWTFFESTFTTLSPMDHFHETPIAGTILNFVMLTRIFLPTNSIANLLANSNSNQSNDSVPPFVYYWASDVFSSPSAVLTLFYNVLKYSEWPPDRKDSIVSPIHKSGLLNKIGNYRPNHFLPPFANKLSEMRLDIHEAILRLWILPLLNNFDNEAFFASMNVYETHGLLIVTVNTVKN